MRVNKKGNARNEVESGEDRNQKKEERIDIKIPFDMKIFWKNIDEKFFLRSDQTSLNEVNHLVQLYSKYGKCLLFTN